MFGLSDALRAKVDKEASRFYKLLKHAVHLRKEQVLIISDYGVGEKQLSAMVAYGYYLGARKNDLHVTCLFQELKKEFMFMDAHVVKALEMLEKNSIIIVAVSDCVGRFSSLIGFEIFCERQGHRFILTTGLNQISLNHCGLLWESMFVSSERMRKQAAVLKKKLDKAKELRFKTTAGTDLTVSIEGRGSVLECGEYLTRGHGGDIPPGILYLRFSEKIMANGTVVVDGSIATDSQSILLDEPVTLLVVDGKIVSWEGKHAGVFEEMMERLGERGYDLEMVGLVAGIGVGLNPHSLLIGSRTLDHLVLGTASIELCVRGRKGTLPLYLPQVFKNPTILVDGEKVVLVK